MLPKAFAAISVLVVSELDCGKDDTESYRLRIIERVLSQFRALEIELEEEDSAFMFAAYEKSRHIISARHVC